MRRRAFLAVCAVMLAAPVFGLAALATAGARLRPQGATTISAGAANRHVASIARRRTKPRPGCGAACRQLGIPQGTGGMTYCGAPPTTNAASVTSSKVLTIPGYTETSPIVAGDLLVAAIVTQGGGVTPPSGWTEVPNTDFANGTHERLQLFYDIPVPLSGQGRVFPSTAYSFTPSTAEAMSGDLTTFTGISQNNPINSSGGEANAAASTSVSAPSITPTAGSTLLLFAGATSSPETWTAPPGMKLTTLSTQPPTPTQTEVALATQRWATAAPTGSRAATISSSGDSVGDLIALNYPGPLTCPHVRILNHSRAFDMAGHRYRGPTLKATSDGLIPVRLKCEWTAACVGALVVLDDSLRRLVQSDISVPAGQTRTVEVATTPTGQRQLRRLRTIPVLITIGADLPNGQLVPAIVGSRLGGLELK